MRSLFALLIFVLSQQVVAKEIVTSIHDIDHSATEEALVFLSNGQVLKIHNFEKSLIEKVTSNLFKKMVVKIQYSDDRYIENIEILSKRADLKNKNFSLQAKFQETQYRPSILSNLDEARSFFYDARQNHKESQCYNRAHTWTYDWRVKRNLYSSKVWLFFTKRYIRRYKFEWWFHVAPMVHVIIGNEVKERMMDIKYARGPIKLKTWTDIFIRDGADCPVIEKYSDQADHPESGYCFLMKSSMYYYQPVDLEQLELTGIEKNVWHEPEVKQAFLDALEIQI